MRKLSAVIITFNEEQHIRRCILSLKSVADEILVVDSGSTDLTKEICLSLNVKFITNKFMGYGEQKQFAVDSALYDFVLSIDADEALSPKLISSIIDAKKDSYHAYEMNRLNHYCGKAIHHSGWYPDRKLRLFDRRFGRYNYNVVHERVELESGKTIKRLKGDILHYSFESVKAHFLQSKKFAELGSKELAAKGKKGSVFSLFTHLPIFTFLRYYLLRLGFLDGFYGLTICTIISIGSFQKYLFLYRYNKRL